MAKRSQFVDYVVEQLAPLGEVTARGMFGGWGLYCDGRMFALIADDTLYVKVDDTNRPEFAQAGLQPFRYNTEKSESMISYYTLPTTAIDDRDELCAWARKGIEAAARAAAKPRRRK
jgi:DNA transformation protein